MALCDDEIRYYHQLADEFAKQFGYTADSDTLKKAHQKINFDFSRPLYHQTRRDIERLFNPTFGDFVEAYVEPISRGVMVKARADQQGIELVQRIVDAWVGESRLNEVVHVRVGSHEVEFRDIDSNVVVAFFAAGRKMHGTDPFRVCNAQIVLGLLGIEISVGELALPDMLGIYAPFDFEWNSEDSLWTSREHAVTG